MDSDSAICWLLVFYNLRYLFVAVNLSLIYSLHFAKQSVYFAHPFLHLLTIFLVLHLSFRTTFFNIFHFTQLIGFFKWTFYLSFRFIFSIFCFLWIRFALARFIEVNCDNFLLIFGLNFYTFNRVLLG